MNVWGPTVDDVNHVGAPRREVREYPRSRARPKLPNVVHVRQSWVVDTSRSQKIRPLGTFLAGESEFQTASAARVARRTSQNERSRVHQQKTGFAQFIIGS